MAVAAARMPPETTQLARTMQICPHMCCVALSWCLSSAPLVSLPKWCCGPTLFWSCGTLRHWWSPTGSCRAHGPIAPVVHLVTTHQFCTPQEANSSHCGHAIAPLQSLLWSHSCLPSCAMACQGEIGAELRLLGGAGYVTSFGYITSFGSL